VHPGHKQLTQYFSCSGGTTAIFIKSKPGHVTLNLYFSSVGIYGSSNAFLASRPCNVGALFSMLRWAHCGFHKKCPGTRYAKLVFLHPLESAGHKVHFGASRPRNVNPQFFMLGWARCDFNKNRAVTGHFMPNMWFCIRFDLRVTKCILVHLGRETSTQYFS
jgi:hypothetical protein